jgi:hypothetical protein
MRQAQRDVAGAIIWAEKHRARNPGSELDRIRLQSASLCNPKEQRLLEPAGRSPTRSIFRTGASGTP